MGDCWAYKAFHCMKPADKLLYVGISDTPADRMNQHGRDKWWWHLVNRIEWFRFDSRDKAASQESLCIAELQPLFNKHQSTLTARSVLFGCLELLQYSFEHCPLCLSCCRHSVVDWRPKFLCTVDVGEELDAFCFEVRMRCAAFHSPIEWTQLIPIHVLCECKTRMPENVLAELWQSAVTNDDVGEDIPELRPPTLADLVTDCLARQMPEIKLLAEAK